MKKVLSLTLVIFMFVFMMVSCSNGEDSSAKDEKAAEDGQEVSEDKDDKEKSDKEDDENKDVESGVYLTVNGEDIPMTEFEETFEMYKNSLVAQYGVKETIKNMLILNAVVMQDLKANGVEVSEERIQKDYDEAVAKSGGLEAHLALLESYGVTEEEDKKNTMIGSYFMAHKEWFKENNTPSDEAISEYYDENKDRLATVKASHILLATEEEAKAVKERLDNGESFEALAKELTLDEASKAAGGLLGDKSPNAYVPEFAEALKGLEPSQVSDPVQTQFGYHIIRVESKSDTLEALKDKIIDEMVETEYETYMKELEENAEVVDPADGTEE